MTAFHRDVAVNAQVESPDHVDGLVWWVNCFEQVSAIGSWDSKEGWGEVFFYVADDYELAGRVAMYILTYEGELCPCWDCEGSR